MEKHIFLFALVITSMIAGAVYFFAPRDDDKVADTAPHYIPIPPRYTDQPDMVQQQTHKASVPKAEFYKWVDGKGVTHFSHYPETADAVPVELKPLGEISIPKRSQDVIDAKRRIEVVKYMGGQQQPGVVPVAARQSQGYTVERASSEQHTDYVKFSGRISGGEKCRDLGVTIHARNQTNEGITARTTVKNAGGDFGSQLFEVSVGHKWKRTTPRDIWTINRIDFTCHEAN